MLGCRFEIETTDQGKNTINSKPGIKVIVTVVQGKIDAVAAVYRPTVMKIFDLYASYSDEELKFLLGFYQKMLQIYEEGSNLRKSA